MVALARKTIMCDKRKHTQREAQTELREIKRKHGLNRERRVYHCRECGAWHLTSDPHRETGREYRRERGVWVNEV